MRKHFVALAVAEGVLALTILGIGGISVYSAYAREKPLVVIDSPTSNTSVHAGDVVTVQSTSKDPSGISRVELQVDGTMIHSDAPVSPQNTYTVAQGWKAVPGTHALIVRAYNKGDTASDPVAVVVDVTNATSAPAAATAAPAAAATVACKDNAIFIADMTVPAGTQLARGQSFVKTWRVRNTGTCAWGDGYTLVNVRGESMSAPASVQPPSTRPGATADLSVPMVAPTKAGTQRGTWQLQNPRGNRFGSMLNVIVNGPREQATCSGTPTISSFTASAATITAGQSVTLSWGAVGNASVASIDNGIGGVGTPGSTTVAPLTTTTYTLMANCKTNAATAVVTINVAPGATP